MTIDKLVIGAIWPVIYGAVYAGLQVFVSAQWPEAPPATVLGIMTMLGVLQGSIRLLNPQPAAPAAEANLPPGVSPQAGMTAPGAPIAPVKQPGKVQRFFI